MTTVAEKGSYSACVVYGVHDFSQSIQYMLSKKKLPPRMAFDQYHTTGLPRAHRPRRRKGKPPALPYEF